MYLGTGKLRITETITVDNIVFLFLLFFIVFIVARVVARVVALAHIEHSPDGHCAVLQQDVLDGLHVVRREDHRPVQRRHVVPIGDVGISSPEKVMFTRIDDYVQIRYLLLKKHLTVLEVPSQYCPHKGCVTVKVSGI